MSAPSLWGDGRYRRLFASTASFSLGTQVYQLALGLFVSSFASVIGNVCIWGYRQESTDSAYIGRISGLTGSVFKLLMPFTLLLSGALALDAPLGLLLSACALAHLVTVLGTRLSAVYRVA